MEYPSTQLSPGPSARPEGTAHPRIAFAGDSGLAPDYRVKASTRTVDRIFPFISGDTRPRDIRALFASDQRYALFHLPTYREMSGSREDVD